MLLVMGLGTQLIHWHPGFCNLLGERGFRVIRFDNRDAGHSTQARGPAPATVPMLFGLRRGRAYHLDDMADDAVGLLDALEIEIAHLTGVSMGGMIAQVAGYRHPDRVRSLALLMSGSGKRVASCRACGRWGRCWRSRAQHARGVHRAAAQDLRGDRLARLPDGRRPRGRVPRASWG